MSIKPKRYLLYPQGLLNSLATSVRFTWLLLPTPRDAFQAAGHQQEVRRGIQAAVAFQEMVGYQ